MQCPSCKSVSPDEVRFCLHCGQFLGEPDEATRVHSSRLPPTTIRADFTPASTPAYKQSTSIEQSPRKRNPVTWALALLALVLALVAVGFALDFWYRTPDGTKTALRVATPSPSPPPTPKPTVDRSLALKEVMEVEQRWHQAMRDGDRVALNEVLADEFRNVSPLGRVDGKVTFVENARPIPFEVTTENPAILRIQGSTVTITLTKTYYVQGQEPHSTLDTDTFIWRDGRWQVSYSQSSYKP